MTTGEFIAALEVLGIIIFLGFLCYYVGKFSGKRAVGHKRSKRTDYWDGEEKAWCAECGAPHQFVRPGKTQPTCNCDITCPYCKGEFKYYGEPDPKWPNVSGWFCPKCGPLPDMKGR